MSQSVPCILCGVDDASVVFGPGMAQPSQIVRCNRCGLMFTSPRTREPDRILCAKANPAWEIFPPGSPRFVKEELQVKDYIATREHLKTVYPNRGRLLEVGCGLGFLLAEFRKDGWDVLGIDVLLQVCQYARNKLGITVINSTLEESVQPEESYDVVLMNHVIEHLEDPLATLLEVNRVLKPGGHLVIETPRYDTLMFRLLGRRERNIACPHHTYFFTIQTLSRLYESAGFQLVTLEKVGRSLTLDRLLWTAGNITKTKWIQSHLQMGSTKLKCNRVKMFINLRDIQRVLVTKPT